MAFFNATTFFCILLSLYRSPVFLLQIKSNLLLSFILFVRGTRQFYEFSFPRRSYPSWHAHFFEFLLPFLYFYIGNLTVLIVQYSNTAFLLD